MAKKGKTEGVLTRETRLKDESAAAAKEAVDKVAAEQAAAAKKAADDLARATPKVWPKKQKKARFVRDAVEKPQAATAAPLPERSTKTAGKMMTQNVTHRPKKEANAAPKAKKPKPENSARPASTRR